MKLLRDCKQTGNATGLGHRLGKPLAVVAAGGNITGQSHRPAGYRHEVERRLPVDSELCPSRFR